MTVISISVFLKEEQDPPDQLVDQLVNQLSSGPALHNSISIGSVALRPNMSLKGLNSLDSCLDVL